MRSQINEERQAVGKGPIGFINPVLYANPWVLTDITNGTNLGCGSEGFAAVEGYVRSLFLSEEMKTQTDCLYEKLGSCHWPWYTQLP
jgi:hypothetical protein